MSNLRRKRKRVPYRVNKKKKGLNIFNLSLRIKLFFNLTQIIIPTLFKKNTIIEK